MDFAQLTDHINAELEREQRLDGSERVDDADGIAWQREGELAKVSEAGSTGIQLTLASAGRIIHERIFARSPMSVHRIARAITEHLTGYVS